MLFQNVLKIIQEIKYQNCNKGLCNLTCKFVSFEVIFIQITNFMRLLIFFTTVFPEIKFDWHKYQINQYLYSNNT